MTDQKMPVSQDQKLFGAVAYISFISIIMLLLKKDDPFISFHARQGIVLFIASLLWFIPILGWIAVVIAYVMMVVGFVKAYGGERYEMPLIGPLVSKIKL